MCMLNLILQGYDGVDLEMNVNGYKFGSQDDEFSDVVCCFMQVTVLAGPSF